MIFFQGIIMSRLLEKWKAYKAEVAVDFYMNISDLITNDKVAKLDEFTQHWGYTRLKHSLDVAFVSYCITRLLGWDSRAAARGGLLHDFYYHDWRDEGYVCEGRNHAVHHPKVALENARQITTLTEVEADIIVKHMWLITIRPPKYKEGFVVTFVDKYCAAREVFTGMTKQRKVKRSLFATTI